MRSPFDNKDNLTDEDKKALTDISAHLWENYKKELIDLTVSLYGIGGFDKWTEVATLVTIGYTLKQYEIDSLEAGLFGNITEKPDAN